MQMVMTVITTVILALCGVAMMWQAYLLTTIREEHQKSREAMRDSWHALFKKQEDEIGFLRKQVGELQQATSDRVRSTASHRFPVRKNASGEEPWETTPEEVMNLFSMFDDPAIMLAEARRMVRSTGDWQQIYEMYLDALESQHPGLTTGLPREIRQAGSTEE